MENCQYELIESICISIENNYEQQIIDEFMCIHYLRRDNLLNEISAILLGYCINNDFEHYSIKKSLTASLLLILPFINSSSKIEHEICEKYVIKYDKKCNNNFCRGLVLLLSMKVSIISLKTKTFIMYTLCQIIECQHNLKLSTKIKDAYNGLIKYCLQILQCNMLQNIQNTFKIKQYATRILLCELNEGVMARQYLKDQYTNLIILQTIIMLYQQYEINNNNNVCLHIIIL